MCHRVHEVGLMQNEHTQILSFLAIHDLIPLLVSDLVQHLLADVVSLLAPTLHWVTSWHSWWRMVAPLGADPGPTKWMRAACQLPHAPLNAN
jgi:hypothetical protein